MLILLIHVDDATNLSCFTEWHRLGLSHMPGDRGMLRGQDTHLTFLVAGRARCCSAGLGSHCSRLHLLSLSGRLGKEWHVKFALACLIKSVEFAQTGACSRDSCSNLISLAALSRSSFKVGGRAGCNTARWRPQRWSPSAAVRAELCQLKYCLPECCVQSKQTVADLDASKL